MKIFKYTAYSLIGAAALLSLGACSPDEVELEPIPFELSYNIYGEYSYEPTAYNSFEVNATANTITLGGANEYQSITIDLKSNAGNNSTVTFDIETPDWVTFNTEYANNLYDQEGRYLSKVRLNLFGHSYDNTVRVNGEKYNTSYSNEIVFAFAPNPGSEARKGEIKISIDTEGTKGNISIPFTQTGSTKTIAPTAISFSETESYYGETTYKVSVDFPRTASEFNYYFMITPAPVNADTQDAALENVLRYMGAYGWLLRHGSLMSACSYYKDITRENFLDYASLNCSARYEESLPGIVRYIYSYNYDENFNGYSRYAVYTVTFDSRSVSGFNVTYFDADGNTTE